MSNYQFINIIILILILYFLFNSNFFLKNGLVFQNQSSKFSFLFSSAVLIYIILLLFLYQTWYGANPTVNFHFFNDWPEWNYMDKFGHFFTAFHISDVGIRVINWIGFSKKKSLIGGLVLGLVFQTPIEIMDGFGLAYGFSWGDMLANIMGSLFVCFQYFKWNEIRIIPKFSFHFSPYAGLRPSMLGHGAGQQFLKDYNGQTYWLSIDFFSFTKSIKIPPVLKVFCLSIGYGADGMVYGREKENLVHGFIPFQEYYLSPDINFEKITTQSKWIQIFLFMVNKLHALMPAIEYSAMHGLKLHYLFF